MIADMLTLARPIMALCALACSLSGSPALAFWLFAAAILTDALDGVVARALAESTRLGEWDGVADSVLTVCIVAGLQLGGYVPTAFTIAMTLIFAVLGGYIATHRKDDDTPKRVVTALARYQMAAVLAMIMIYAHAGYGTTEFRILSVVAVVAVAVYCLVNRRRVAMLVMGRP